MEDDYMLDGYAPVAWWAGVPVKATKWIMAHHPEADEFSSIVHMTMLGEFFWAPYSDKETYK